MGLENPSIHTYVLIDKKKSSLLFSLSLARDDNREPTPITTTCDHQQRSKKNASLYIIYHLYSKTWAWSGDETNPELLNLDENANSIVPHLVATCDPD
jgi:hypothetical protein